MPSTFTQGAVSRGNAARTEEEIAYFKAAFATREALLAAPENMTSAERIMYFSALHSYVVSHQPRFTHFLLTQCCP